MGGPCVTCPPWKLSLRGGVPGIPGPGHLNSWVSGAQLDLQDSSKHLTPRPPSAQVHPVLLPLVTFPGSSLITLRNYPGSQPPVLPQGSCPPSAVGLPGAACRHQGD